MLITIGRKHIKIPHSNLFWIMNYYVKTLNWTAPCQTESTLQIITILGISIDDEKYL